MVIFFFVGLGFILIGLPLALRKISRNGLYGVRIDKTTSNEAAWFQINQLAGVHLIADGLLLLAITAGFYFFGEEIAESVKAIALIATTLVLVFLLCLHVFVAQKKLAE